MGTQQYGPIFTEIASYLAQVLHDSKDSAEIILDLATMYNDFQLTNYSI